MSPTLSAIKAQHLGPIDSLEASTCDHVTDLPPPKTPPELVQNSGDPCIEEEL